MEDGQVQEEVPDEEEILYISRKNKLLSELRNVQKQIPFPSLVSSRKFFRIVVRNQIYLVDLLTRFDFGESIDDSASAIIEEIETITSINKDSAKLAYDKLTKLFCLLYEAINKTRDFTINPT